MARTSTKIAPDSDRTPAGQRHLARRTASGLVKSPPKFSEEMLSANRAQFLKLSASSRAELMTINPAMAAVMLEHNTANRPVKINAVVRYVQAIKDGDWLVTSETIGFSDQRTLVDGQNRLFAVLQANKPIRTWVIFGVDRNAFKVTNTGEKRRLSDALQIMNVGSALNVAAALRGLFCYLSEDFSFKEPMTVFQGEEVLKRHGKIRDSVRLCQAIKNNLHALPVTPAAVCHYIFTTIDRDRADQFFERLRYGLDVQRTDPEYVLREIMVNESEIFRRSRSPEQYAMIIRAWNARRKNYVISKAGIKNGTVDEKDGEFPVAL